MTVDARFLDTHGHTHRTLKGRTLGTCTAKIDYNLSWYVIKVLCNFVQMAKVECIGMDLNRASRSCHPGPADHDLSRPSVRTA